MKKTLKWIFERITQLSKYIHNFLIFFTFVFKDLVIRAYYLRNEIKVKIFDKLENFCLLNTILKILLFCRLFCDTILCYL